MKPLDTFAQAKDQLDNLSPNISLAILHPDFHGQHRLFGPLFDAGAPHTIYVPVIRSKMSLADLLSSISEATQPALSAKLELPTQPAEAAETLAKTIKKLGDTVLVIDGYDMVDHEEVTPFMTVLGKQLPSGCRILLAGRELPMHLMEAADLEGKTALVPTNPDKMMLDYAQSRSKTLLEVRALGPGRVLINGRLVEHWDGVLPRTLFFYFVDRGMTTRDEIFQTFWPNLSTREATNVFHVTKRKISEILGADLTVYWSGFYRISPELELHYDVIKFAEAVQNAAVAEDDEAVRLMTNAIDLYHGPFLSTINQGWVLDRRSELSLLYADALAGLARIFKRRDDHQNALGCFLRAASISPQREDLARSVMEIYRDLGQSQYALETYDRLVAELRSSLNVSPGPQTADLAEEIRASV